VTPKKLAFLGVLGGREPRSVAASCVPQFLASLQIFFVFSVFLVVVRLVVS